MARSIGFLVMLSLVIAACNTGDPVPGPVGPGGLVRPLGENDGVQGDKFVVCHCPPGNPAGPGCTTLSIAPAALQAHLDHGDATGPCASGNGGAGGDGTGGTSSGTGGAADGGLGGGSVGGAHHSPGSCFLEGCPPGKTCCFVTQGFTGTCTAGGDTAVLGLACCGGRCHDVCTDILNCGKCGSDVGCPMVPSGACCDGGFVSAESYDICTLSGDFCCAGPHDLCQQANEECTANGQCLSGNCLPNQTCGAP